VRGCGNHWEMILQLDLATHSTLQAARGFLAGNPLGTTLAPNREQAYTHLERLLRRYLEASDRTQLTPDASDSTDALLEVSEYRQASAY